MQKDKNRVIPFQFGLLFTIISNEFGLPTALELSWGEEKIVLERDFWPRAKEWEALLMNYITRKDFH